MTRPIYGFWQRFLDLNGKPKGKWGLALYAKLSHARRMHAVSDRYSQRGPVFRTEAQIPKRYEEGKNKP